MVRKRNGNNGEDIEGIWREYIETRSYYLRNKLTEIYALIVKSNAEIIYGTLPNNVELDDLVSAGFFGMLDAVESFDPGKGIKFETYAHLRVRGAILDELRAMDFVPRLVRARSRAYNRAVLELKTEGRQPTREDIRKKLGVTQDVFERIERDSIAKEKYGLNAPPDDEISKRRGTNYAANLRDIKLRGPLETAFSADLRNFMIRGLSREERLILTLYYYEDMSMKEIGMTIGLSETSISRMHAEILNRLRHRFNGRGNSLDSLL